jgi:hypothetical protein
MASRYRVQIVDEDGRLVQQWVPGLAAEVELINNLANRVAAKPVGLFKTNTQVKMAVIEAAEELLRDLKTYVPQVMAR